MQLTTRYDDPTVEALRGLAAIMVLATHYVTLLTDQPGLWSFASTGVDLFFVLSGYVFAPYLFGKPLHAGAHLIRRFFRLYPLYLLALLLYVVLRLPDQTAWQYVVHHMLMAHTLSSIEIAYYYNAAFWSLPPEVEFYLLLPFLAWLLTRFAAAPYRFVYLFVGAAVVHLALVAFATPNEGVTPRSIASIHLPGLLIEFMCGAAAHGMLQRDPGRYARRWRLLLGSVVLLGVTWLFANYIAAANSTRSVPPAWIAGNIGLAAAMAYGLLLSAVASTPGLQPPGSGRAWMLWLGQLSYGVYLLHNAAPQIMRRLMPDLHGMGALLFCVLCTVFMATCAHYLVERPLRSYGRTLSQALTK